MREKYHEQKKNKPTLVHQGKSDRLRYLADDRGGCDPGNHQFDPVQLVHAEQGKRTDTEGRGEQRQDHQ